MLSRCFSFSSQYSFALSLSPSVSKTVKPRGATKAFATASRGVAADSCAFSCLSFLSLYCFSHSAYSCSESCCCCCARILSLSYFLFFSSISFFLFLHGILQNFLYFLGFIVKILVEFLSCCCHALGHLARRCQGLQGMSSRPSSRNW